MYMSWRRYFSSSSLRLRLVCEPLLAYPGQLAEARHCGNLNSQLGHGARRDGLQIDGFTRQLPANSQSVMQYSHVCHRAGLFLQHTFARSRVPTQRIAWRFEIFGRN